MHVLIYTKVKEKTMLNKKFYRKTPAIVLALGLVLAGCATRIGDFTMLSTQNVDLSRAGEFRRSASTVEGKDTMHIILGIKTKANIDLKEAIDKALAKFPGAVALVNARLYTTGWSIFGIYGQTSYIVSGTALVDPNLVPSNLVGEAENENKTDKYVVMNTADGETYTASYISESEYNKLLASLK
jgi:hypothetical protein